VEFNYAEFGKIGLQTMFISLKSNTDLTDEDLKRCLVDNPRTILGQELPTIAEGSKANFFLFTKEEYVFDVKEVLSLSKNTAEIGQKYGYKIKASFNGTDAYFAN
jgi:dihydroorotase-like cyclic amidohydrolase